MFWANRLVDEEYILDEDSEQITDEDGSPIRGLLVTFSSQSGGSSGTIAVFMGGITLAATQGGTASTTASLTGLFSFSAEQGGTLTTDTDLTVLVRFSASQGATSSTDSTLLVDYVLSATTGGTCSTSATLSRPFLAGVVRDESDLHVRDEAGAPIFDESVVSESSFSATAGGQAGTSANLINAISFHANPDDTIFFRNRRGRISAIASPISCGKASTSATLSVVIRFQGQADGNSESPTAVFEGFLRGFKATQGGTVSTTGHLSNIYVKYSATQGGTAGTNAGLTIFVKLSSIDAQGEAGTEAQLTKYEVGYVTFVAQANAEAGTGAILGPIKRMVSTSGGTASVNALPIISYVYSATATGASGTACTLRRRRAGGKACQGLLTGVYRLAA